MCVYVCVIGLISFSFSYFQKMNLTAVREASEIMERHIEDSLAIIPPIQTSYVSHCDDSCDNISLVDVGSGAGLPGLVLAIACPGNSSFKSIQFAFVQLSLSLV